MKQKAKIYAKALFNLTSPDQLYKLKEDLEFAVSVLKREKYLLCILFNPNIEEGSKRKLISLLSNGAKEGEVLYEFLLLLYKNRELSLLGDINKEYNRLIEREGIYEEVEIFSSVPLESTQVEELKRKIKGWLEEIGVGEKELKLRLKIDPTLIGGVKIKIKDKIIDASLSGYLLRLKEHLTAKL
jgi:F-type H+-transporting ATPase subunit delta